MNNNALCFVIDTNVLVSALLFENSVPYKTLEKVLSVGHLLQSKETINELKNVLSRKKFEKYLDRGKIENFLSDLQSISLFLIVQEKVNRCEDPKDNMFLELAITGKADCIISGDDHLLRIENFEGIPLLTAKQFLELEE